MAQRIEDIKRTLTDISKGEGIIEMLMEFSRTLDSINIFAYKNWLDGELVLGPVINKYWFITEWMFPQTRMPDPNGALRLEKIGCKVSFRKQVFKKPVRVLEPSDWSDVRTKQAEMEDIPIYLVKIIMPKKFITAQYDTFMDEIEKSLENMDDDINDLAQEYDTEGGPEEGDMGMGGDMDAGDAMEMDMGDEENM